MFYTWASVPSSCQDVNLILFTVFLNLVNFSPTSDGSAAAVLASEEFVKKHGLESKAVEIVGMEMATDFNSTFTENSAIKVVSPLGSSVESLVSLNHILALFGSSIHVGILFSY